MHWNYAIIPKDIPNCIAIRITLCRGGRGDDAGGGPLWPPALGRPYGIPKYIRSNLACPSRASEPPHLSREPDLSRDRAFRAATSTPFIPPLPPFLYPRENQ